MRYPSFGGDIVATYVSDGKGNKYKRTYHSDGSYSDSYAGVDRGDTQKGNPDANSGKTPRKNLNNGGSGGNSGSSNKGSSGNSSSHNYTVDDKGNVFKNGNWVNTNDPKVRQALQNDPDGQKALQKSSDIHSGKSSSGGSYGAGSDDSSSSDDNNNSSNQQYYYIKEPAKDDYEGWYGAGGYYDTLMNDPFALPDIAGMTGSNYQLTIPTEGIDRSTDVYGKYYDPNDKMLKYVDKSGEQVWQEYVANPNWRQTGSGFDDSELGDVYNRQLSKYAGQTSFVRNPDQIGTSPSWYDGGTAYNEFNDALSNYGFQTIGGNTNPASEAIQKALANINDYGNKQVSKTLQNAPSTSTNNNSPAPSTGGNTGNTSGTDNKISSGNMMNEGALISGANNLNPNNFNGGARISGEQSAIGRYLAGDMWKNKRGMY